MARPAFAADVASAPNGLKLGVASYSFRKFPLDQAIAMTRELGLRYICLKDVHLPLKSTTALRQRVHKKIVDAGLVLMGGGVIYLGPAEAEIRRVFDYARDAGMPTIVCSPDPRGLDTVERMAREYDIRIAIHNHGPRDKWYKTPLDILQLVKDRDQRMGVCIDVGHTVRAGVDPVAAVKHCGSRVHDFHLKDVATEKPNARDVIVGQGVIDIPGVLQALRAVTFSGHLGLEYELTPENPLPGMKKSVAYVRKVLAMLS